MRELTARERQVMDLVCLGKTNDEIGLILGISPCTVATHLVRLRRMLNASRKPLMVAKYLVPEKFKR